MKSIVQLLSPHDKIGIIAVSNEILLFKNEEAAKQCPSNNSNANNIINKSNSTKTNSSHTNKTMEDNLRVYSATYGTKKRIIDFIESLNQTQEATNHSLGFKYSFALLKQLYGRMFNETGDNNNNNNKNNDVNHMMAAGNYHQQQRQPLPITFLYVTRGLLFPLTEARTVMDTIAKGQANIPFPVVINTCAVIIDEKRVMYEKQFLNDIVVQNYSKYAIDVPTVLINNKQKTEGIMYTMSGESDIQRIALEIFTEFYEKNDSIDQNLKIHAPAIDTFSKGELN